MRQARKGNPMNQVNLLGRLTKDPEDYTSNKKDAQSLTKFTVAINRNAEQADFIRCTAFGKTADVILDHCKKGQMIALTGHIATGSYEKDGETVYTTDVIVDRFYFAEGKHEEEEQPKKGYAQRSSGRK